MKKSIVILLLTVLLAVLGCTAALAEVGDTIDSRGELFDFLWAHAQDRPEELILPPATAWDVYGYLEQIEDVLWHSGAVSYNCSYDPTGRRGVTLTVAWREEPFYLCETTGDVVAALTAARDAQISAFGIYTGDSLGESLFADDLLPFYHLLLQAGYSPDTSIRYSPNQNIIIHTPSYTSAPSRTVETEEELISALRGMYRGGHQEFYIILSETLANSYNADRLWMSRIESRALVTDSDYTTYPILRVMHYTAIQCEESAVVLTTLEETSAYLQGVADDNLEEVWLFCTPELMETLLTEIPLDGLSISTLDVLGSNVGLMYFDSVVYRESNKLRLHTMTISPAQRILRAVRSGDYAGLTSREFALLSTALEILESINANTVAAYLWELQAALAERIEYTIDPSTDDDDCAFGALLNGEANCDGYADAFDLCAGLAGLDTMMVSGVSTDPKTGVSTGHAWNLVRFANQWYSVDATWADGDILRPMYFLLGMDRAPTSYTWPTELYPTLAARTLTGQTPYTDLAFDTIGELADYLSQVNTEELGDLCVFMPSMETEPAPEVSEAIQEIMRNTVYRHTYTMDSGLILLR